MGLLAKTRGFDGTGMVFAEGIAGSAFLGAVITGVTGFAIDLGANIWRLFLKERFLDTLRSPQSGRRPLDVEA